MNVYRLKLRVYYEDTDAGGVVYHARYLAFAERARTEALREAGVPHDELVTQFGLIFVVRRIEMHYLRPVRLDAEVVVTTGPWALRAASVEVRQDFAVLGKQVASEQTGRLVVGLACVGAASGRPARIPQRWRDALSS